MKSGVSACSRPSAPATALNAASKSFEPEPRIGTGVNCMPSARAASSAPLSCTAYVGCAGCVSIATCLSVGTTSLSSCRRFPARSAELKAVPVMLPPGRARLGTRPISTGWFTVAKTIGIDAVAFLAGTAADDAEATMRSTCRRTNSSASYGSCSMLPNRNSMTTFWPSTYPRSRRPC